MKSTEQMKNLSTLEHGKMVFRYFQKLIEDIENGLYNDKPYILKIYEAFKKTNIPYRTLKLYMIFHDCGKWKCLTIDDEGRRHFPNHAEISYEIFRETFPHDIDAQWLIRLDMLFHTGSCEDIKNCIDTDLLPTLALTAIAELHANASMFGGMESTSFKIKAKKLSRNLKHLTAEKLHKLVFDDVNA